MRLSKKSEYACLALLDLAERYHEGLTKSEEIAVRKDIPQKYLEQIMLQLKGAGYVRSVRGPAGGFRLAKPPEAISLAEIIRLIDGPLAPIDSVSRYFYEPTPLEKSPKMLGLFRDIRDFISDRLEQTRFSDLI